MRRRECGAEADGTTLAVGGGAGGGAKAAAVASACVSFAPSPPPTGASGFSWESCVFGFRGLFFSTTTTVAIAVFARHRMHKDAGWRGGWEGWKGGAGCDRLMIKGRERERPGWGKKGVLLSRSLLLLSCNNGGRSEERENSPAIRPLPPLQRPFLRREPFSRQLRREEGRGGKEKKEIEEGEESEATL